MRNSDVLIFETIENNCVTFEFEFLWWVSLRNLNRM